MYTRVQFVISRMHMLNYKVQRVKLLLLLFRR